MAAKTEIENEMNEGQSETVLPRSRSKQVDSDEPLSAGSQASTARDMNFDESAISKVDSDEPLSAGCQASTARDMNFDESAISKVDSDEPLSAGCQASTARDMNFDESAISKVGFEEPLSRPQASTTRDAGLHGIPMSKTLMPLHKKE